MRSGSPESTPVFTRRRIAAGVGAGVLLLALAETVSAVVSPWRAPTDADWDAAAKRVRAGFKAGDLIVAAPAWADPVMRLHLGDLVPPKVAARLDAGRFPRVWEITQRGARAPESEGGKTMDESAHGALRLRLVEKNALPVTFDFVESWGTARVVRLSPGRGEIPCERQADRHQCPEMGWNFVQPRLLEIGLQIHRALHAQPVQDATIRVDYPDVPMGRELAVGAGLHSVWWRRHADGRVFLRVLVDGKELGKLDSGNRTGWTVARLDTSAWRGRRVPVRFEITCDKAYARHFGFAAEARGR